MRFRHALLLTIVLFCLSASSHAQSDGIFKSISWIPAQLASGSPCLLTVEFENSPAALQGEWFGHQVDFFPSGGRSVWYALAGADVETVPGSYPLTLHATMLDGKRINATREIHIEPSQ